MACTRRVHPVRVMYHRRRSTSSACDHLDNARQPPSQRESQHSKADRKLTRKKKAGKSAPLVLSPLCSNTFVICDLRCAHDRLEPAVFPSCLVKPLSTRAEHQRLHLTEYMAGRSPCAYPRVLIFARQGTHKYLQRHAYRESS